MSAEVHTFRAPAEPPSIRQSNGIPAKEFLAEFYCEVIARNAVV